MDVVYPYKSAPDDFELRYSLRSLVNVDHDRVVIAGDRPIIIDRAVQYVAVEPVHDRYRSSTVNLLAAIDRVGVSGDFILMHDDIFLLEPWHFQHEHRAPLEAYIRGGGASGEYLALAAQTRDILLAQGVEEPLFFGLHTPTIYNAGRLVDLVREFEGQRYLLRTLYHNLFPAPSRQRDDVKVRAWVGSAGGDVLSISDECATHPGFKTWIATRFPERCRYELGAHGRCLILGYAPTVWAQAEAAMDREQFDAVIASPEAAEHWPGDITAIAHDDHHAEHLARVCGFEDWTWCGRTIKEAA
ncbi:hypothetical protein GHV40_01040 [Devosia sp. D6-9]|nr:hypothetical protein GHV40_01040 [Devosia sp. D6-9]